MVTTDEEIFQKPLFVIEDQVEVVADIGVLRKRLIPQAWLDNRLEVGAKGRVIQYAQGAYKMVVVRMDATGLDAMYAESALARVHHR